MQEGVALISDIHEAGVESRHNFPDFRQVDVAHRILLRTSFLLKFHETLVFQQGDGDVFLLDIDDNFACHDLLIALEPLGARSDSCLAGVATTARGRS